MNKDYKGVIIEESLEDNIVLNNFNIVGLISRTMLFF